jgi:hypothetical protein
MSLKSGRQGFFPSLVPSFNCSSEETTLFADPDPQIFIAAIPLPEPYAHSASQYVE